MNRGVNMALTKQAGAWTYDDLFALPDDGKRYEIIEGELYELPPVGYIHAFVVMKLITQLIPRAKSAGAEMLTAPLDVFFEGADPVQPDILVILEDGKARFAKRGVEGPPDLLIEVISPFNRVHDVFTKRALYARSGVREYWIVDPDSRTLEILTLDRDAFHLTVAAAGSEMPVSPLLGQRSVAVGDLFPTLGE